MIKRLLNNWNWKILSLAVAFSLWLLVMNYEDPFVTRTFRNVPVVKLNEEAITSQRKAIDYRSGESVTLVLEGPRSIMDRFSSTDIFAYADLSKVSVTNAVDIEININEKLSIKEQDPMKMEIDLENIITVQKEIQPYYDGELASGHVRLNPSIVPSSIEVTGPESKVALVSKVFASVNINGATDDVSVFATPLLVDENNEAVQGVTVSNTLVEVQVPVQKLKTISLSENIDRTIADGYGINSITLDKDSFVVRGEDDKLDQTDAVVIGNIDLTQYTEATDIVVDLTNYLPEGLHIYGEDNLVTVHVDIEPIEVKLIEFTTDDITVTDVAEGLAYSFTSPQSKVFTLKVQGTAKKLEGLSLDNVDFVLSMAGLTQGSYNQKLEIHLPEVLPIVEMPDTVGIKLAPTAQ